MTDRIHALTVILDKPIRDDDVEDIVQAIRMIRHVVDVKMHIHDVDAYRAENMAKRNVIKKLLRVIDEIEQEAQP